MMARFGVEVLILQRSVRLIPDHEPEVGRAIQDYFEQAYWLKTPSAHNQRLEYPSPIARVGYTQPRKFTP
jgi:pyruvate/2-oxoglutarate dehydrogenase complex dihydrolipoamide dehydrogenase (E3) component